ncbi:ubiquitin carboxyl-terminal hydrolase 15-like isoform X2 [Daktulosphaira vitifoliae]|uniref:ubiquitin carboxyl-terminal hydrolase 15-like isoform X2 n=1 Tax=Daktulosphaira vitifoliae TaxID=58002 RepID=UPI0021A9A55C|nr:ubiquitin carboxyl-terminal hydrolase 15-like isoform X2 [Daktulosphaira vitifoliae]
MRSKAELYVGSSIDDLMKMCKLPDQMKKLNAKQLTEKANLMYNQAMFLHKDKNDEETVYIYLMKYCEIMQLLKEHKEYKNDPKFLEMMYKSNLKKALKILTHLRSSLVDRYKELENDKNKTIVNEKQKVNLVDEKNSIDLESTISNKQLLYLLRNTDAKKILLLDTRPPEVFLQNQITLCDIINVPKDVLTPDLTADSLKNKLLDIYKQKWNNRHQYNYVVILDQGTEDIENDHRLINLRSALLKWDPSRDNSKKLKFLKGGYEDFIHLCPWETTQKITELNNLETISDTEEDSVFYNNSSENQYVSYPSLDNIKQNLTKLYINSVDESVDQINSPMEFIDSYNSEDENEPIGQPSFDRSTKPMNKHNQFVTPEIKPLYHTHEENNQLPNNTDYTENRNLSVDLSDSENEDYHELMHLKIPRIDRSTKPLDELQIISNTKIIGGDGLRGLQNLGNTCYMNCILQCLSNTEDLTKYFINIYNNVVNLKSRTKGLVAKEFKNVIFNLWSQSSRSFQCQLFKDTIGQFKDMFKHYDQQDSHEFLTILLDWLHDDLNQPENNRIIIGASKETGEEDWGHWTKDNNSIIQQLFYGQQKSSVSCNICSEKSITFEPFSSLSLPLPSEGNRCTLSDCLKLYLNGESISGWNCPKCKRNRDATKKLDIMRLPPYLIIHLKRFSSSGYKKNSFVQFPNIDLDMTDFINGLEHRNRKYYLYGVSNHSGSLDGGHYTAYCLKKQMNKWYKFDDVRVYEIDSNMVCSSESYILFYCRKNI